MNEMTRFTADQEIETLRVDQNATYNWAYDNDRAKLERLYKLSLIHI